VDIFSYCCLSISSNQPGHSLTSGTKEAELPLTGYFLFSDHSLQTLEMVVQENPSISAISESLSPTIHVETLKLLFFPILMLSFKL